MSEAMTIGEVFEMQPGDKDNPSWVNGGFTCLVSNIVAKKTRANRDYWTAMLSDPDNPGISLETTFFRNPGQYANRICRFSGQGMTRTEYNGKAQLGTSQKTIIQVVSPPLNANRQTQNRSSQGSNSQGSSPGKTPIAGESIGMAIKLAGDFMIAHQEPLDAERLHQLASDIIRVSEHLKRGHLAPKPSARQSEETTPVDPLNDPEDLGDQEPEQPPEQQAAPLQRQTSKPTPGPEGSAFNYKGDIDDDIPF